VAPALVVAVGYYLAAHLGFALTLKPHPTSTLWPPNALLMAALLLAPARAWWWLLAAALPAHLAAELQSGVPTGMVLGWYFTNCSEALIGAALVRVFVAGPLRLDGLRSAGVFFVCGALAAPLLSSFLDAALVRSIGWGDGTYWALVRTRFFSNVLAEITVGALILAWAGVGFARPRATPRRRCSSRGSSARASSSSTCRRRRTGSRRRSSTRRCRSSSGRQCASARPARRAR
jgi:integral membrane sensor domain MASE1